MTWHDEEELFDHRVTPWTVGELRKAIDGLSDQLPICAIPAEEPGDELAAEEQVVIGAGVWTDKDVPPSRRAKPDCLRSLARSRPASTTGGSDAGQG